MNIIFWDYDGTLVNTETIYRDSLKSFFNKNNYNLKEITNEYFYKNIAGRHPEEFLKKLEEDSYIKKNLNLNPMEIKKYYTIYFENLEKGQIKITKDIDAIINNLSKDKNIIMCITSSSYFHDFKIKHTNVGNKILNKNFDIDKNVYLCGSIKGCKFKPEPDIFIYTIKDLITKYKLSFSKIENLFIIEDSTAGCKAGKSFKDIYNDKLNIKIIGYLAGAVVDNGQELLESGADVLAGDINELENNINITKNK